MGKLASLEILVVEDMECVRNAVVKLLQKAGFRVDDVADAETALMRLCRRYYDLVIADYKLTGMNGYELLCRIKKQWPATEVMIVTSYGTIPGGVQAMRQGAFDYVTKPYEPQQLLEKVTRICEEKVNSARNVNYSSLRQIPEFQPLIGGSAKTLELLSIICRVATSDSTILIHGESGTGKELVARCIHDLSDRAGGPYQAINCGAILESLQESELFGHTKGSFTSAHADKKGLFECADSGTVFLDEIGEMALSTQVKLLRFLQESEFRRVGENFNRRVDVRLIAATNKNLEDRVSSGSFREDLFYRINVIPIAVPPLRERKDDIPLLLDHFVKRYSRLRRHGKAGFSKRAVAMLMNHDWPGNVRELENLVQRSIALAETEEIGVEMMPAEFHQRTQGQAGQGSQTLEEIESQAILATLHRHNGNKQKTAQELGISKATLWRKLKSLDWEQSSYAGGMNG
jgi:DNA-binding NtrC family response regulator